MNRHLLDHFYVVTMISNPVRFKSRYELYKKFEKMVHDAGGKLITVEVAFGDRAHEVTSHCNPNHIQLRTIDEIWVKENCLNIAISRLPCDWKMVAFVDADISFARSDWLMETAHALQHYEVVQMWSHALDLGPNHEPIQHHRSFMYCYHENFCHQPKGHGEGGKYSGDKHFWHPGFAWAFTRRAIDRLGGLLDTAILGSGDHSMAMALVGLGQNSFPKAVTKRYAYEIMRWQERAEKYIKRDVGFIHGTITHNWHGKKRDRRYVERWDIVVKNHFDPDIDLKKDCQGLYQLEVTNHRQRRLRDEIRHYFRQRNEDSIDL